MIYHDYSLSQIESMADELNKQYNSKRLSVPMQADVFDIIDMLGARIAIEYLTPDRSCLGATTFKDGTLWIWPDSLYIQGMQPKRKFFYAGMIIIDADLDGSADEQDKFSENYTVIHECFHYAKHQASFKHCAHYSSIDTYTLKQMDRNSALYKIERQANYAAAAFLMPRQAVINGAREYFKISSKTNLIPFGYATKDKIKSFGKLFGVNYSPMVYRMQEIGLLDKKFDSSYI